MKIEIPLTRRSDEAFSVTWRVRKRKEGIVSVMFIQVYEITYKIIQCVDLLFGCWIWEHLSYEEMMLRFPWQTYWQKWLRRLLIRRLSDACFLLVFSHVWYSELSKLHNSYYDESVISSIDKPAAPSSFPSSRTPESDRRRKQTGWKTRNSALVCMT